MKLKTKTDEELNKLFEKHQIRYLTYLDKMKEEEEKYDLISKERTRRLLVKLKWIEDDNTN